MKVNCPHCENPVLPQCLSLKNSLGKCVHCHKLFRLDEFTGDHFKDGAPTRPSNSSIVLQRTPESLRIHVPASGSGCGLMIGLVFPIGWLAFVAVFTGFRFQNGFNGGFGDICSLIFMVPFWLLGIAGIWRLFQAYYEQATIVIDAAGMETKKRWRIRISRKWYDRDTIQGVRRQQTNDDDDKSKNVEIATERKAIEILCFNHDEQRWLIAEINSFLDEVGRTSKWKIHCPNCTNFIMADGLDLDTVQGQCDACETTFSLMDLIPDYSALTTKTVKGPVKTHVTLQRTPQQLVIHAPARGLSEEAGCLLLFATFLLLFVTVWTILVAFSAKPYLGLFSIPFWIIGFVMLSKAFWKIYSIQTLRINSDGLCVTYKCLRWTGEATCNLEQLQPARIFKNESSWDLHKVTISHGETSTIFPVNSEPEQRWVITEINSFLDEMRKS